MNNKQLILNYNSFIDRVSEALSYNNKTIEDINIVPAIKTQSSDTVNSLLSESNIKCVGENRVQELLSHYDDIDGVDWHFIGNLQTNKVKYIIDKVKLFHSVDRLSLADKINKESKKRDLTGKVLIEINIGNELSKGGIAPEEFSDFINSVKELENVEIQGLMAIVPFIGNKDKLEYYFKKMNDLYLSLEKFGIQPKHLSMGMSNDFELALKCGSNLIRPGRIIFGERNYA